MDARKPDDSTTSPLPYAAYGLRDARTLHLAWPGPPPHRTRCGRMFYGGQAHWVGPVAGTDFERDMCPRCRKSWRRMYAPRPPAQSTP